MNLAPATLSTYFIALIFALFYKEKLIDILMRLGLFIIIVLANRILDTLWP